MPQDLRWLWLIVCWCALCASGLAQQGTTQPQAQVENPIQTAEERRKAEANTAQPLRKINPPAKTGLPDEITIDAATQEYRNNGQTLIATGNVQAFGDGFLVIADRVTFSRITNDLLAEGNIFFEQEGQKLVGERLEFNVATKRGSLFTTTGFTDRTPDGTAVTIDAERADKTGKDTFNLENVRLTACNDAVPKWSFTARRARIRIDHRAKVYNALFRIRDVPVLWIPYASVSISKKDRSSGFLLPSSGSSNIKGRTLHVAYYQTLGRSADVLVRTDLFSKRGVGLGFDFRARTNETSRIQFGSFLVIDRVLGPRRRENCNPNTEPDGCKLPNEGGSSFYADAVHHFKNGFVAVADVNITSSYAFRNVFAENILTAISPEERSIFYLNRNWQNYSFNAFFGEQSFFIGRKFYVDGDDSPRYDDRIVKMRQFPALELNRRSSKLAERFPVYLSFESSLGGVRRSETRGSEALLKTPSIVQRLDFFPRLTFPLKPIAGFTLTPSVAFRSTFYSDSVDSAQRAIVGRNLFRNFAEFHLDLRAPALAKIYRQKNGMPWFKHLIEPYAEYRRIIGIDWGLNDFRRTIRTDERDVIAETNEVEYGFSNKFFTRRASADGKSTQAYEWMDLTIAQKYFFDPSFGGALRNCTREEYLQSACARNQFFPINTLTGFSFGGVRRYVSPLNVRARVRPSQLVHADLRLNYDTQFHSLREIIFGGGINKGIINLSNTWYYTRRVALDERRYATPYDPSSLPGNQFETTAFLGNPTNGPYGGATLVYDLRKLDFAGRPILNNAGQPTGGRLIALISTGGWAWDCCSLQMQRFTFNAGARNENRYIFSFTLKGIGTFGTQNIGQRRNF